MDDKRFMVIILTYDEEDKDSVKVSVERMTAFVNSKKGKSEIVYEGEDERIVNALDKILNLTK
jgi:hypothetical protein